MARNVVTFRFSYSRERRAVRTVKSSLKNLVTHFSLTTGSSSLWAVVLIGVAFRFRAFFEGRSLWLDEALLGVNYLDKSFFGLITLPLANGQSAPPGFLAMSKLITDLFGIDEYSIRIVPLVFGVLSVFLAALISHQLFSNLLPKLIFASIVSFSPVLIYYSVELKQYSLDVFAVLFFIWSLKIGFTNRKRIALALAILFLTASSLIAIPVFAIWATFRLFSRDKVHTEAGPKFIHRLNDNRVLIAAGAIGSALQLFHALFILGVGDEMRSFWSRAGAFPPQKLSTPEDLLWYPLRVIGFLSDPFINQQVSVPRSELGAPLLWIAVSALVAFGIVFFRRNTNVVFALSILLLPVVLSHLQIYPVGGRLTLFTIPATALLIAFAFEKLMDSTTLFRQVVALTSAAIILGGPILVSLSYFVEPNDSKDTIWALKEIEQDVQEDEIILADVSNRNQISFHQQTGYGAQINLERTSMDESEPESDWSPAHSGYWMISTHRVNRFETIIDNLLARGYVQVCSFAQEGTYVSRLRIESDADGLECEFNR